VYKHAFTAVETSKCSRQGIEIELHRFLCDDMHFLSYSRNVAHASLTIFGNIAGLKKRSTTDNVDTREENLLERTDA